jgi:hypothetical protein
MPVGYRSHLVAQVVGYGGGFPDVFLVDSYTSRRFPTFCLKTRADLAQFTTSTMSTVLPCAGSPPREDGCT